MHSCDSFTWITTRHHITSNAPFQMSIRQISFIFRLLKPWSKAKNISINNVQHSLQMLDELIVAFGNSDEHFNKHFAMIRRQHRGKQIKSEGNRHCGTFRTGDSKHSHSYSSFIHKALQYNYRKKKKQSTN